MVRHSAPTNFILVENISVYFQDFSVFSILSGKSEITRSGGNTNLSVSYIITISMGIVNTLTKPCHEKIN